MTGDRRLGARQRLAGRLLTGPVGHGAGTILDWLSFSALMARRAARSRIRARRRR